MAEYVFIVPFSAELCYVGSSGGEKKDFHEIPVSPEGNPNKRRITYLLNVDDDDGAAFPWSRSFMEFCN